MDPTRRWWWAKYTRTRTQSALYNLSLGRVSNCLVIQWVYVLFLIFFSVLWLWIWMKTLCSRPKTSIIISCVIVSTRYSSFFARRDVMELISFHPFFFVAVAQDVSFISFSFFFVLECTLLNVIKSTWLVHCFDAAIFWFYSFANNSRVQKFYGNVSYVYICSKKKRIKKGDIIEMVLWILRWEFNMFVRSSRIMNYEPYVFDSSVYYTLVYIYLIYF